MLESPTGSSAGLVQSALAASSLGAISSKSIAELTFGAKRLSVGAGFTIRQEGDTTAHLDLVLKGLVRVRVAAPDGRTLTARYCRPGALLGVATLYTGDNPRVFATQALVDSELLCLLPEVVRQSAGREVEVTTALLTEASQRVLSFVSELSSNAFAPVPQRVARHLLDLAHEREGDVFVATASQQDLADAVGTAREVVVRILRELRRDGVVETRRQRILILDPERLAELG